MKKLKTMIISTSRADYGILFPLIKKIGYDSFYELHLVVTGSHLSKKHGHSINEIVNDGIAITDSVNINVKAGDEKGVCRSIAKGIEGFADVYNKHSPSLVIVLGDRHELMAACIPAVINKIPIAHIHGGEVTKGAVDDSIRHSITKMSAIHFPSIDLYARRIIQMGENPEFVFAVGALGIDNIVNMDYCDVNELSDITGVDFTKKVALMTYHPVTLDNYSDAKSQTDEVFEALLDTELITISTMPNADAAGMQVFERIQLYADMYPQRFKIIKNMGRKAYLSAMKHAALMVGNSSSGIIESSSFKLPVVNIGDRQFGRLRASNVIDCDCNRNQIANAISNALSKDFKDNLCLIKNPYGDGKTADRICSILKTIDFDTRNKFLKKGFYDLNF